MFNGKINYPFIASNNLFQFLALFVFGTLSLIGLLNHEIWLDEAYHYLLHRDVNTIFEMFQVSRKSGHPLLWNIILFYGFKTILGMKLLHSFLAFLLAWVFLRYSPFSKLHKLFIIFGYYFFYEYNLINKNYILGILLVFISLVLFQKQKSLYLIAVLLALAANCHLFTLIIAFFVMLYFTLERKQKFVFPFSIFLLGCIISLIQIIPPLQYQVLFQHYDPTPFFSFVRFERAIGIFSRGILNVPDYTSVSTWNSNFFSTNSFLLIFLSALIMVLAFISFKNNKKVLLFFFLPLLCIMAIIYITPLSIGTRYWGYAYIVLIIATWLMYSRHEARSVLKFFFTIVITIQFIVGSISYSIDIERPFSSAKDAVAFIKKSRLEKLPVFHELLSTGPSYSAYSGEKIFYPLSQTYESYSFWCLPNALESTNFLEQCKVGLLKLNIQKAILVTNKNILNYQRPVGLTINFLSSFENSIIASENYYLYLIAINSKF